MMKLEKFKTPWDQKVNKAYFRGIATGKIKDEETGEFLGRLKLVNDSITHPD